MKGELPVIVAIVGWCLAAFLAWLVPSRRSVVTIAAGVLATFESGLALALHPPGESGFGLWVFFLVSFVFLIVAVHSPHYIAKRFPHPSTQRTYYLLINLFGAAMALTTAATSLIILWVGVEATTLTSVFLVALGSGPSEIEAAWKYFVVTTVGALFALVGTVLALGLSTAPSGSLGFLAALLIVLGYGAKVGLTPAHTWLPDAHATAPATVSALLSGVELNCALYAMVRALHSLPTPFWVTGDRILTILGLVSLATGTLFLLVQNHIKRFLAYSTVAHMAVAALGIGTGTVLGLFGALYALLGHALMKSALFLTAGEITLTTGSEDFSRLAASPKPSPRLAWLFLLASLSLAGVPPFPSFWGDLWIAMAVFRQDGSALGLIFLLLLALAFAGVLLKTAPLVRRRLGTQTAGRPPHATVSLHPGLAHPWRGSLQWVELSLALWLGLYLPRALESLMKLAVR